MSGDRNNLRLTVISDSSTAIFPLIEGISDAPESEVVVTPQIRLKYEGTDIFKAEGIQEVSHFILKFLEVVVVPTMSALAAHWIYDKLKGQKVQKLIIDDLEVVEIEEVEIRRVIQRKLQAHSTTD